MEKILVSVYVVSLQERFDLFIPMMLTMQELAGLIASGLAELTNGRYEISGREMLCLKDPDTLLNQHKTPEDFGLRNGDELVLF
jgi:hypothetical protein